MTSEKKDCHCSICMILHQNFVLRYKLVVNYHHYYNYSPQKIFNYYRFYIILHLANKLETSYQASLLSEKRKKRFLCWLQLHEYNKEKYILQRYRITSISFPFLSILLLILFSVLFSRKRERVL